MNIKNKEVGFKEIVICVAALANLLVLAGCGSSINAQENVVGNSVVKCAENVDVSLPNESVLWDIKAQSSNTREYSSLVWLGRDSEESRWLVVNPNDVSSNFVTLRMGADNSAYMLVMQPVTVDGKCLFGYRITSSEDPRFLKNLRMNGVN